jgi:hypothetical protein
MRTTVEIDDEVLEVAKGLSAGRKISLGKALSELARRGAQVPVAQRNGFYIFVAGDDLPGFGLKEVQAASEAEDLEYGRFFRQGKA